MIYFWSIGYPQSAVALYIHRAGWTYPARNPFYKSESTKNLILLRLLLDRSDRSVSCRAGYSALPVRPLGQTGQTDRCQFWLSTYAPLFFGKACMPKNILQSQNCLRTMINITSAIFHAKGDKQLSAISCLSWCWNNLFRLPYLLHDCWCLWLDLYLLLHCFLVAHTLQPSLLSMR